MAIFDSTAPEVWYPISGFDCYEISSHLRLRTYHQGSRKRGSPPRIIKVHIDDRGYRKLILWRDRKYHNLYLHRVVAAMVYGPCPDGHVVRHKDDDKSNNWPENLCYGTDTDNAADCIRNGHQVVLRGSEKALAKLEEASALAIIRLSEYGICRGVLEECFGVDRSTISRIISGDRWSHVG